MTEELLTLDDIAALYKTTVKRARVLVYVPGFPAVAPGSTPRQRRWVRREVLGYIHRRPERVPNNRAILL